MYDVRQNRVRVFRPAGPGRSRRTVNLVVFAALVLGLAATVLLSAATPAGAQEPIDAPTLPEPTGPSIDAPSPGGETLDDEGIVNFRVDLGGNEEERPPGSSIVLIVGLTLLSVAPSLVVTRQLNAPANTIATVEPLTSVTTFIFPPYKELVHENPPLLTLISVQ